MDGMRGTPKQCDTCHERWQSVDSEGTPCRNCGSSFVLSIAPGSPGWLSEVFSYHPATPAQVLAYEAVRHQARALVASILGACPASADRTAAIRLVREAVMTANASIALRGLI